MSSAGQADPIGGRFHGVLTMRGGRQCFVLGLGALLLGAVWPTVGWAQEGSNETTVTRAEVAATPPADSWRTAYRFGPGDVVNFRFYGRPELDRPGQRISPDGRLSYLQASGVAVANLTLDEIRTRFEGELQQHYRYVRLILTPGELVSKRYIILGKVVDKGVFTLDRPVTVLEAIARARGFETGLFEQKTIELADLRRSFLIRGGQRMPVDFEALYFEGDLQQNLSLEPDDYLFIASNISNEFYVMGAVARQGVQGMAPGTTVVNALSRREGFAPTAWRERVLVVRGSLEKPTPIVVNVTDILAGRAPDVVLQPGDIVYVHVRPWARAEQVLNGALNAFVQSMTATWVNTNVPDAIRRTLLPQTDWREDTTAP